MVRDPKGNEKRPPGDLQLKVQALMPRGTGLGNSSRAPNSRIESAIGSETARSPCSADDSPAPAGQFRPAIRSPGTEVLDAETGGRKSTRETVIVGRDR